MCKRSWKIGDRIRVTGRESLATYSLLQNEAIEREKRRRRKMTRGRGWLIEVDSSFSFFPSVCLKKKGRELIYSAWKKEMWPIKKRRHDWSCSLERVNISRGSYKDLWCNCEDKTGCDRRLQIPDLLLSLSLYIYISFRRRDISGPMDIITGKHGLLNS